MRIDEEWEDWDDLDDSGEVRQVRRGPDEPEGFLTTRRIIVGLILLAVVGITLGAGHPDLAFGAFVLFLGFGTSILSASLTLAIMTQPVIIASTKQALEAVLAFRQHFLLISALGDIAQHPHQAGGFAFGIPLQFDKCYTEGISRIEPQDVAYAEQFGYRIKHQIGRASCRERV